jgi:protein TonB
MFNNLIESSSHAREYKRRGSFLLFTTGVYAVLLSLAGVASIYAYDAHLDEQTNQLELISFVPPPTAEPERVIADAARTRPTNSRNTPAVPTRTELISSVTDPTKVPDHPGTAPVLIPPAPPGAIIGPDNADPPGPAFSGRGVPTGNGNNVVTITDPPPAPPATPTPTPAPPRIVKVSHILNSQAQVLPRPNYPPMAKQIHLQGTVTVQVLIDETGKVVSAKALSGHPLFVVEAQRAAMGARFSPTIIGDQPVKVSGVITYNFVMPQ